MLRNCVFALGTIVLSLACAQADTIQLKDKAAVTGKILAEKKDQVAVDVGYTVLVIPRNQVTRIVRGPASEKQAQPVTEVSHELGATQPAAVIANIPPPELSLPASAMGQLPRTIYTASTKAMPVRSVRELVHILGESVVQVRTPAGLGSGFFVNEDGYLITNFHVIEGESQISIEVYHQQDGQLERKSYKQVRIIAMNKFADLALLKVEDPGAQKFKAIVFGDANALAVGERVFAIGSPLGLERTVTEGIVSTKTRQMSGELYLQTTAQINPGNSGGPLFNMSGEVVGVTNMKITFGEGLGFAIPVEAVRFFLDNRDAFGYSNDNPSNAYRYLQPPSKNRQIVVTP